MIGLLFVEVQDSGGLENVVELVQQAGYACYATDRLDCKETLEEIEVIMEGK